MMEECFCLTDFFFAACFGCSLFGAGAGDGVGASFLGTGTVGASFFRIGAGVRVGASFLGTGAVGASFFRMGAGVGAKVCGSNVGLEDDLFILLSVCDFGGGVSVG